MKSDNGSIPGWVYALVLVGAYYLYSNYDPIVAFWYLVGGGALLLGIITLIGMATPGDKQQ